MSTSRGTKNLMRTDAHRSSKLEALLQRCRETYRGVRETLTGHGRRRLPTGASEPIRADVPTGGGDTRQRQAVSLVIVHRGGHPSYPGVDPSAVDGPADSELALELRRLIAWSDETIADVTHVLETRAPDLDKTARALLQDEVEALEIDLASLKAQLLDPVDWNREFGYLLAGEVAPFDDLAADDEVDGDD